jgi:glycosyltransferase involved in cell wall biosynthesis
VTMITTGSEVSPKIAVLLPCYNEGPIIGDVVRAFRNTLPTADVYVFDNNSNDDTVANAASAGAIVRRESAQGKGNVVRRMFADVEADVYVLADGDGTYDTSSAAAMINLLLRDDLDIVVGTRMSTEHHGAFPPGHVFGNRFLTATVAKLFRSRFRDILSGYRVMSRRFVKSFPALARGFEIEAMLTVHTLELRLPYAETECVYFERGGGTTSKLRTYRDGARILGTIVLLFKETHPLRFFGFLSSLLIVTSLGLGIPVVIEFIETGLVPRVPTAVLATGLMILAGIGITCGLILDTVSRGFREMKRLNYLSLPSTREIVARRAAKP